MNYQVSLAIGGIEAENPEDAVRQWAVTMDLPLEALEGMIFEAMDDETGLIYEVLVSHPGLVEVLE